MYRLLASSVLLALVVVIGSSCRQIEETDNPASHVLTEAGAMVPAGHPSSSVELTRLQFDDIPAPRGFFLRNARNESYGFVVEGLRVGRFVYWGRGEVDSVREGYTRAMEREPFGWSLRGPVAVEGGQGLVFEKTGQRAVVTFETKEDDEMLVKIAVEST